jgi:predicted Zn finger-like uncharacterized protein
MIVICEECGKKYRIDAEKIKGKSARFKCKSCNHVITVTKPEPRPPAPSPPPPRVDEAAAEIGEERPPAPKKKKKEKPAKRKKEKKAALKTKGLGLRSKMLLLFLLIPVVFIAAAGALYIWQLDNLTSLLTTESSSVVTRMAENAIAENARSVAKQCGLYIAAYPNLKKENYNYDEDFKRVAVQKVGLTGYTALYELPDSNGIWRTWAHANPKIIGIDMSKLKKPLGKSFPGFWKVFSGVKAGKESKGYYNWQDADGGFRDKFMVCTPIKGTRYIIASTTYLDEFTRPIKLMETRARKLSLNTRNLTLAILAATIILIGVIVSLYGAGLTGRIKSLTDIADRISVGELDEEIEIKSKDEIGALGEAISRMQESIRLSIERLRRRR